MNHTKIQDKLDKKLIIAIYKNDIEKVEKLIEKGANPDTRIVKGIPALFLAVWINHVEIAKQLADRVDVNENVYGLNALQLSCECNYPQMTQMLIDKGADVNQPIYTFADLTIRGVLNERDENDRHSRSLKLFGKPVKGILHNKDLGISILEDIVSFGESRIADILIRNGAVIPEKNKHGESLLSLAISRNQSIDMINLLIEYGLDINAKNNQDVTPLMYAVIENREDIVKLLVNKGADISARDNKGQSAFLYIENNPSLVDFFLDRGEDINQQNNKAETLLIRTTRLIEKKSAKEDLEDVINRLCVNKDIFSKPSYPTTFLEHLLAKGAIATIKDVSGKTAFDYVISENVKNVFKKYSESSNFYENIEQ